MPKLSLISGAVFLMLYVPVSAAEDVGRDVLQEVRQMAIAAGQSSSSKPKPAEKTPEQMAAMKDANRALEESRDAFLARLRERGINVSGG